jgi:hypothetical protein
MLEKGIGTLLASYCKYPVVFSQTAFLSFLPFMVIVKVIGFR